MTKGYSTSYIKGIHFKPRLYITRSIDKDEDKDKDKDKDKDIKDLQTFAFLSVPLFSLAGEGLPSRKQCQAASEVGRIYKKVKYGNRNAQGNI